MIEATYGLNTYLNTVIQAAGYGPLTFYPGTYAGSGAATDNYAVYNVSPATGIQHFFIHSDTVTYRIYHSKFDTLKHMEDVILANLNVENIQSDTRLAQTGVRYLTTHAICGFSGQAIYIEGSDYFVTQITVSLVYTTP